MPIACRKIDNTIIILVKDVIPSTREGNTVSPVIKASICNDKEYCVSPLLPSETFSAGKPFAIELTISCASEVPPSIVKKRIQETNEIADEFILYIIQNLPLDFVF